MIMKISFATLFLSSIAPALGEHLSSAIDSSRFLSLMQAGGEVQNGEPLDLDVTPAYLFENSVPEGLQATPFSGNGPLLGDNDNNADNLRGRRLATEYSMACADPDRLYEGTTHSGRCTCDTSFDTVDRVLCVLDGFDCSQSVCIQEDDIWLFDKTSGQLISRSTCLRCVDTATSCSQNWVDTCFNMEFDGNDEPESCSLLLADTDPLLTCSTCSPCTKDGKEGMNFDCFNSYWDSKGSCITSNRLALHPFDDLEEDKISIGIIVGIVVGLLVVCGGIAAAVFCCRRNKNGADNQGGAMSPPVVQAQPYPGPPVQAYPAETKPDTTNSTEPDYYKEGSYAVDL